MQDKTDNQITKEAPAQLLWDVKDIMVALNLKRSTVYELIHKKVLKPSILQKRRKLFNVETIKALSREVIGDSNIKGSK